MFPSIVNVGTTPVTGIVIGEMTGIFTAHHGGSRYVEIRATSHHYFEIMVIIRLRLHLLV